MEFQRSLSFLFVILMLFCCSSQAYKFSVGGKDGWVLNPSENYNHWAERNRFQVNDTLFFKYKKGCDSVLIVTKEDYNACNTTTPIKGLTEGDSVFKFNRSGPFFFISGNAGSCEKGQKLIVVVMAVRNVTHQAPSPATGTPTSAPPMATPPTSPSPAAVTPTPPPPKAESPESVSPESSQIPSDFDPPAPAPSSSPASTYSVALVSSFTIGVTVILGSFVGFF